MNRTARQVRDEWLVLRAQDGDEAAFAQLVASFHPRLLAHARHLTGGDDAAADAVQDAWLAVVRGIRGVNDPSRFRAWAYRVVTNTCADRIRAGARERRAARAKPPRGPPGHGRDDDAGVSAAVRDAMSRLGPDQRGILSLRYLEDMSTREIADVLGVPVGTVKSRLHAARDELKSLLERSET